MSDDNNKKEKRIEKAAQRFSDNLKVTRPGFGSTNAGKRSDIREGIERQESIKIRGSDRIDLSEILWMEPSSLEENPYNEYPPLSEDELRELSRDISEKGVIVPLILRMDEDVLICGHNRRRASIEAKESPVPVQRVLRSLTEGEERDLMKSENDRRRGGNWTKERKEEFIREHFGEEIHQERRGFHKKNFKKFTEPFEFKDEKESEKTEEKGKRFTEPFTDPNLNLAKEIEKKSRGKITEGTAKRIISGMRKDRKLPAESAGKARQSLSEKDRKRGEKLALHLKMLRQTRVKLEEKLVGVKEEERRVIRELKTIGQPELFGV